jgi:hypothetical protein
LGKIANLVPATTTGEKPIPSWRPKTTITKSEDFVAETPSSNFVEFADLLKMNEESYTVVSFAER